MCNERMEPRLALNKESVKGLQTLQKWLERRKEVRAA
jgi:hypothetical protein